MTSKQHRSLNRENFRTAWKEKLKLCYKVQKSATVKLYSTYLEKKKSMMLAKKAQLNPKKVRLCICHEARWVSSKAGCSALAFSGGYRRGRKVRERRALRETLPTRAHRRVKGPYTSIPHWGVQVQSSPSSSSPLAECQLCQAARGR